MAFHTWQLLKGVALATLIDVGAQLSLGTEAYGNKEEVADLIPSMLEAILDSDRSFKRSRSVKVARAYLSGSRDQE